MDNVKQLSLEFDKNFQKSLNMETSKMVFSSSVKCFCWLKVSSIPPNFVSSLFTDEIFTPKVYVFIIYWEGQVFHSVGHNNALSLKPYRREVFQNTCWRRWNLFYIHVWEAKLADYKLYIMLELGRGAMSK